MSEHDRNEDHEQEHANKLNHPTTFHIRERVMESARAILAEDKEAFDILAQDDGPVLDAEHPTQIDS